MNLTIDANVFISTALATEIHHRDSVLFFTQLRIRQEHVICPTLLLPECSGAIARRTNNSLLAEATIALIESAGNIQLVSLDIPVARQAAQAARLHFLRGADAVYVAVAQASNSTLITWDIELHERVSALVPTMTPVEWLATL